jgi:hypothetical protein
MIAAKNYPYVWGGGHNSSFSGPYDCSGAVSADLHAAGLLGSPEVSGNLMNWGQPGYGKEFSIFASPEHVFMEIMGRQFGTHGSSGAGWYTGTPLPAPPASAISAARKMMNLPAGSPLGKLGTAIESIKAPIIKGGGAVGSVAQHALNIATKAANIYLQKHAPGEPTATSAGTFTGKGASATSGGLMAFFEAKGLRAIEAAGIAGNVQQESSFNPNAPGGGLFQTIGGRGIAQGSSFYAQIVSAWNELSGSYRSVLMEMHHAKTAAQAARIFSGTAAEARGFERPGEPAMSSREHYAEEALRQHPSHAAGGMVGSHIRRIALRHIREKIPFMHFAEGGNAPWGGRPVPIIAHEGERIMNPAQYGETARLAGTSPGGLDRHLGYDSHPRQHFAVGGAPRIRREHAQATTPGRSIPAESTVPLPEISSFALSATEMGTIGAITKVMKIMAEGFKKISTIKDPVKYAKELESFFKTITESNIFESLSKGREILKQKLARKSVSKEYSESTEGTVARYTKGGRQTSGMAVGMGQIVLGPKGQVGIDTENIKNLQSETVYLAHEAKAINAVKSKIVSNIKKVSKMKKTKGTEAALNILKSEYIKVEESQRSLAETMSQNIESRYQTETQKIQDEQSKLTSTYQVAESKHSQELSKAQGLGDFGKMSSVQTQMAASAQQQISNLQPVLQNAAAIGNTELVHTIETEMNSLQQTIDTAAVEQINNAQSLIQRESQKGTAELGLKQTKAQSLGNLSEMPGIDQAIIDHANDTIRQLQKPLEEANKLGDIGKVREIQESIIGLESTIATTTADKITQAQALVQRESGKAEAKSGERLSISKVLSQEGRFGEAGGEEKLGLEEKKTNLSHVKEEDERLKIQAIQEHNTGAEITLTEELNKNSSEIAENNLALKDNAVATRELVVGQIEQTGQFKTGIFKTGIQALETIGKTTGFTNVKGMLELAKGEKGALGTEREELGGQAQGVGLNVNGMSPEQILAYLTSPQGQSELSKLEKGENIPEKESMRKLVTSLDANAIATLTNAEEIAKLNGQLNQPQTWGTAAHELFRTSFFTGMGQLNAPYQSALPPGSRPEGLPQYGTATPGQAIPAIGTLNLTHPVQTLNPQLLGEQIAFNIATNSATP